MPLNISTCPSHLALTSTCTHAPKKPVHFHSLPASYNPVSSNVYMPASFFPCLDLPPTPASFCVLIFANKSQNPVLPAFGSLPCCLVLTLHDSPVLVVSRCDSSSPGASPQWKNTLSYSISGIQIGRTSSPYFVCGYILDQGHKFSPGSDNHLII